MVDKLPDICRRVNKYLAICPQYHIPARRWIENTNVALLQTNVPDSPNLNLVHYSIWTGLHQLCTVRRSRITTSNKYWTVAGTWSVKNWSMVIVTMCGLNDLFVLLFVLRVDIAEYINSVTFGLLNFISVMLCLETMLLVLIFLK